MLNSSKCIQFFNAKHQNKMKTQHHYSDIIFDRNRYTIEWSDIENAETDYDNYLNDIETSSDGVLKMMTFKYIYIN